MKIEDLITGEGVASALPQVYYDLKSAIDDVNSEFEDFEHIIKQDTMLTARLLKIVNSPFFGVSSQVETIGHAVSIIGLAELNELALSTFVLDKFKAIPSELFDINKFTDHSIFCGTAAKLIAEMISYPKRETLFTSGMLHDIGRLVLCVNASKKMTECFKISDEADKPLTEVESEIFGFDHTEVGMALLNSWKLPLVHIETAGFHHRYKDNLSFATETAIIHVADLVAWLNDKGDVNAPNETPVLDDLAWAKLGLGEGAYISRIQDVVEDKMKLVSQAFI